MDHFFYFSLNVYAPFELSKNSSQMSRFQKPNYINILSKKWLICARRPRNQYQTIISIFLRTWIFFRFLDRINYLSPMIIGQKYGGKWFCNNSCKNKGIKLELKWQWNTWIKLIKIKQRKLDNWHIWAKYVTAEDNRLSSKEVRTEISLSDTTEKSDFLGARGSWLGFWEEIWTMRIEETM